MKKLLIVSLLLISGICAGQNYSGTCGISVGYLSSTQGPRIGMSLGLTRSYVLSNRFNIDVSALYMHKGANLNTVLWSINDGQSIQLNCIDMPIVMMCLIKKTRIGAGIGLSIVAQAREKYKSEGSSYMYRNINAFGLDFPLYVKIEQDLSKRLFIQVMYSHGTIKQTPGLTRTLSLSIGIRLNKIR